MSGATDGEASASGGRSGPLAEWIRFLGLSDPGGSLENALAFRYTRQLGRLHGCSRSGRWWTDGRTMHDTLTRLL